MALSLTRVVALINCVLLTTILSAQDFTTPGLPWTYVPKDQVPAYAVDTAYEREVLDYFYEADSMFGNFEVRHLYRIHFHPLLTELDSLDRITVEIPRNPGESELVVLDLGRVTQQILLVGPDTVHRGFGVGGFRSQQSPELTLISLGVSLIDRREFSGSLDSTVSGEILLGPGDYRVWPNFPGDADAWAYFIQFVDSVWHPPIVSDVEEMELPDGTAQLSLYPNPAQRGSIVSVALPEGWRNDGVSLRLYDPTGRRVLFTRRDPQDTHKIELPKDCPAGVYTLTAYRLGGKLAVGRVVVR